ncbi:MBL fold metallo-hydrolase [Haloarcula sp. K1]|uniref:MBL fold metallo-hydrolase n=1 Tax=Haloarcula sp. K1 TaxID=1622207 RepID=UPI0007BAE4DA|nr:MBL fold metallo-hydrolase [Haloarcula sp. K1]KZX50266.1 MBL fold metallo-hydrolase [Haloarcula sp. K1]
MGIGDVYEVTVGDCTDVHYVDTGMYDVAEYGSVYIIDAERPALVDTGIGARHENILSAMESVGIAPEDLEVIATTHVHLDHAGGAGYLVEDCPNATVYVHESGKRHLVDPQRLWEGTKHAVGDQIEFYGKPIPVAEDRIETLTDGDVIDLGDHSLDVMHAPGHAPHQVVFYDPVVDGVFTADAAGIYTPATDEMHVTTPPVNFTLEGALDDVTMLQDLDPDILMFGHYGPAETGDKLETYAEILPEWVAEVERKREELGDDEAVIDYFLKRADTDLWGERKGRAEMRLNVRGVLVALDNREE